MSTFNQGVPGVATLINSSATILSGNAASANALTVRQFGGGNVFSAQTTTGSTALFVGANGNVGIGTTDPKGTFNVLSGNAGLPDTTGSGSSNVAARIQSGSICLDFGSIGGTNPFWIQNHLNTAWNTTYPILLNPNGGNVGIGTTNPGYTLQVNGSIGMVGGTTIPVTLPAVGSQTSYGITLAASGTWYTIISDARINATITGAIGQSDLTSTIFIATLYASGGANASMTLVTGSATNIRVSGTALQFNAVSGLYGLTCNFTLLRHN